MERERISRILELREILLSFQTDFSLVNAAVVCAIPQSISGLEPSSVITEPRYLKLVTVSSFYLFTLIFVLMPLVLFVITLVFSPNLFNIFLERIMAHALEDHEGTVNIGGRTITNLCFAGNIDGLAGEEEVQ